MVKMWQSPQFRGPSASKAAEGGVADIGQLSTLSAPEYWCSPSLCSLDTGSVSNGSVCISHTPVQAHEAQKVTPPSPSLPCPFSCTAGRKGQYPTAVECQVEMRHYFSFWKLNRIIPLSCFSVCCFFLFIKCFQSPAKQENKQTNI